MAYRQVVSINHGGSTVDRFGHEKFDKLKAMGYRVVYRHYYEGGYTTYEMVRDIPESELRLKHQIRDLQEEAAQLKNKDKQWHIGS